MKQKIYILPLLTLIYLSCASQKKNIENKPFDYTALFQINQENLIPTRWDVGNTTVSNEDRLDVLIPHVTNIGNVYIGVGAEQNLTIAAWAKSEFIYLMDFTQVVVSANQMMIMFLRESPTKEIFLSRYAKGNETESFALIDKNLPDPENYKKIFTRIGKFIRKRHKTNRITSAEYKYQMFQTNDEQYEYIRNLALNDRIFPVKGNLLGTTTLKSIGETLRRNGKYVGILYFSNAEEYFFYPKEFKESILNLPTDESSLVVRTLSVKQAKFPWSPGSDISTDFGFHYCVQPIQNFQEWLSRGPEKLRSDMIMENGGEINRSLGITVVRGLPKNK
ncbi:hypothetical protein EHQ58_15310 [Leptospira ognonensis]|uniref:DUF7790 domain-containing protein n=1 Tax=Leptospira ognonensis TaxID=2484945 RepID=A0A4R9JXF1_9LEPT|nr:hypothetical protein [Leptospira ognonensis]TGL57152.1 hypothetical protein EHQ58_15310 [Leptospira ognonensis]